VSLRDLQILQRTRTPIWTVGNVGNFAYNCYSLGGLMKGHAHGCPLRFGFSEPARSEASTLADDQATAVAMETH